MAVLVAETVLQPFLRVVVATIGNTTQSIVAEPHTVTARRRTGLAVQRVATRWQSGRRVRDKR